MNINTKCNVKNRSTYYSTQPNPTHHMCWKIRPNPTQPNPWMDPTHVHLCLQSITAKGRSLEIICKSQDQKATLLQLENILETDITVTLPISLTRPKHLHNSKTHFFKDSSRSQQTLMKKQFDKKQTQNGFDVLTNDTTTL
jgi:hypothetical protein